ncbi:MAG: flagellar protein FliT [Methylophilaceae bacterium]
MTSHEILSLYESVSDHTGKMLAAAKTQNWEELTRLETASAQYIHILHNAEELEPLSGTDLGKKIASIKKILADDREIRHLVEPWMARLSSMLNSNGQAQKLSQAYGQDKPG